MSSLLLIGCGNMGSAMLASWKKNPAHGITDLYVIDPNYSASESFNDISDFPSDIKPDVIMFAVKPQQLADILPEYKKRFGGYPLYISIAAGKTIEFFAEYLGSDAKIIRAMPNTPAFVGKATTALCAGVNISDEQKMLATRLMEAFGKAIWVVEKDMDAVTAISGSGPAYVFLFLDVLTKAGVNAGLDAEVAKTLAAGMLHGSVHLAEKSEKNFTQLRENVTSKGGTTEAAISVLMQNDALENLIDNAVQEAIKRAKELAS